MLKNKGALDFNSQILESLLEVTQPLFSNSCVRSFRYFRVFEDGTYANLSTNHEWLLERVERISNNGKCFHKPLCEASENEYFFYLWEQNIQDPVLDLMKAHDIFNGISAYKRNKDSVEAWSFGATTEETLAPNFYINNIDFLKSFISHFNNSTRDFIDIGDRSMRAHFDDPTTTQNLKEEDCKGTSHTPGSSLLPQENEILSPRELQCLRLISMGNTVKGAALQMEISPRTAETYMSLAKNKLGCTSRQEAIDYYWSNYSPNQNIFNSA